MALNLGTIFAFLGADTSGLDSGERRMARFVTSSVNGFRTVEKAAGRLTGVLAGIVGGSIIKKSLEMADSYRILSGRLMQATKSANDYYAVQNRIQSISLNTGTGYEGNIKLFQNLNRSAPEIGATDAQVVRLMESLDKLGVISGATGVELKNSLRQFGQSMAGGIVRAEEFNSILENTPEIANRIASGMGLSVGKLRALVLDGKVLSKDVFASLLKQSDQIDKDFANMPTSMSQGMESLKTGSMSFLGNLDSSLGLTAGISSALMSVGAYLGGDFSGSFFAIKNYVMEIGDSLAIWDRDIKAVASSLGVTDSTFDSIWNKAKEWGSWLLDAIAKMPANLRFTFEQAGFFMMKFFTSIWGNIQMIGPNFDRVWAVVKLGAIVVAQYIAQQFTNIVNNVMRGISGMASYAAGVADKVGWKGAADSINALSAGLKDSTSETNALTDALQKSANGVMAEIVQIDKKKDAIAEVTATQLDGIETAASMSQEQYEADIGNIEKAKIERQNAYEKNKAQLEEIKKIQEAAYGKRSAVAGDTSNLHNPAGTGDDEAKKAADKLLKETQAQLKALENLLATAKELEDEHYKEALQTIDTGEKLKIATIVPYYKLRERLEREHQVKLQKIAEESAGEITRMQAWTAVLNLNAQQKVDDMSFRDKEKAFNDSISQAAHYSKTFFEMNKALAMANALIKGPEAVLASFAFGSELGGPIVGAIFGGIAAAAVGVQIAGIASQQFSAPSKATGGNTFANGMYRVNENGPEVLSIGGEDFLMMGSKSGVVTPKSKPAAGGGKGSGGRTTVNIHNYAGIEVSSAERDSEMGKTLDFFLRKADEYIAGGMISGKSKTARATQKSFGLGRGKRS